MAVHEGICLLLAIGGGMCVEFLVFVAVDLHFNGQSNQTVCTPKSNLLCMASNIPNNAFCTAFFYPREHFRDLNCTAWCGLAGSLGRSLIVGTLVPRLFALQGELRYICVNFRLGLSFSLPQLRCARKVTVCACAL